MRAIGQHRLGSRLLLMAWLVLAGVASGCAVLRAQVESPRVTLSAVNIESLGILEQRFQLTLRVQNPNDFPINIAGMDYRVSLNDREFASGVTDVGAQVPATGEAMVTVPVTASLLETFQHVMEWRSDPPDDLRYALDGNVRLSDFNVKLPFDYSGTVPVRKASN